MCVCKLFLPREEAIARRRQSYDGEVLFADLVEDHLADVFVEGGGERNLRPLVISTHQKVGFI